MIMGVPVDVILLQKLYTECVVKWHEDTAFEGKLATKYKGIYKMVYKLHLLNYKLWHLEDITRRRDIEDKIIAETKRNIDILNQERNDTIEAIDEWLYQMLILHRASAIDDSLPMNSETPGSIMDRMSVLALKIYHMDEQTRRDDVSTQHIYSCQKKLYILQEQAEDLSTCLEVLLKDIFDGKKKLKIYRQFKMYNDPKLNPQLYEKKNTLKT
jgi:hypothetical protein